MSSVTFPEVQGQLSTDAIQRVIVTWQHPHSRAVEPVGLLAYDGELYEFRYLKRATQVAGFRPLMGFGDLTRTYRSSDLFPLFAQRVMDPRRPDYSRWVSDLSLEPDSSPWEQIVRSEGIKEGDSLQLFPVPRNVDGLWRCLSLVHGIRHLLRKTVTVDGEQRGAYSHRELEELLSQLTPETTLELIPEHDNDYSPMAVLVATSDRTPIGYIPHLLVQTLSGAGAMSQLQATVRHVNGPDAGWHLRLLVELSGRLGEDFDMLEGSEWALMDE